jgi:hypothetical protein
VRWGAVRAFCERIGTQGKRDGGGDWWLVKGAQRTASWRRNGRGGGSDSRRRVEERRGARCHACLSEGRGLTLTTADRGRGGRRSVRQGRTFGGGGIGGAWPL